jgi:GNAT superfamily N-acetyltransferase
MRGPERRRVRPAGSTDLPQVVSLCRAHALHERAPLAEAPSLARLEAALAGAAPALAAWCLVGDDGQVHGYASGCQAFCTWTGSPVFILDCLYLEPSYRGHGDGRRLLEAVAAYAQARGCSRLEWVTPAWNAAAIGFYHALGARSEPRVRFRLALPRAPAPVVSPRPRADSRG